MANAEAGTDPCPPRPTYYRHVQFSAELVPRVLSGEITLTFRLWRRAQVKVGGRYRIGPGQIHVDAIDIVPFAAVDDVDLRCAGEPDRQSLRSRTAHAGPVHDHTLVYRIEFHVVEPAP